MSEPESVARLRRAAALLRERAAEWSRVATLDDPDPWDREAAEQGEREALALAAWLDAEAKREAHSLAEFGYRVVPNEAHELARLVLREDEGSEG